MEGNIPGEFVDEVRSRIDIVELVSQYVHLKKSGRNFFGLCPFHPEKTPSFSVAQDKQIFHCFGCGEGGNVFGFLMKMEGLTFPEAVRQLAARAGLRVPGVEYSGETEKRRLKEKLMQVVQLAAGFFQHILDHPQAGKVAREYLAKRGISLETATRFGLGYAPENPGSLKNFLGKGKFTISELVAAGLLVERDNGRIYHRFRNRLIFPIHNQRGEVIAFGGRLLGQGQPKYLNSPETPLFDKSKNLYAFHLARESIRKENRAIIFEGYMDVITAHQAGISNAVASLGTSLTEAQARLLRNQAQEAIIVYDADIAGQAATWRGLEILRQAGCLVKVGRLPQGLDPDDFIRKYGAAAFRREILDGALLLGEYQIESLAEQYDLRKEEGRIHFIDKLTAALCVVPNAIEREGYLEKAAMLLQVPVETVREELRKKQQARGRVRVPGQSTNTGPAFGATVGVEEKVPLQILCLWSRFPHLIGRTAGLSKELFPPELQAAFSEAWKLKQLPASRLHDLLPEGKYRRLLGGMLLAEEDENIAVKALDDCVKRLQCIQVSRRRKELEEKMAKLDPLQAKGEFSDLSKKWLELRKLEEALSRPGEGGKNVG